MTLKTYGHLTGAERAQLELIHKQGHGPAAIGRLLGRAKGTVSRELRRFEGMIQRRHGAALATMMTHAAGKASD
jgi:IS30 family transposase